jgi:hypothetical protein
MLNSLKRWAGDYFDVDLAISQAIIIQVKICPQEKMYYQDRNALIRSVTVFFSHARSMQMRGRFMDIHIQILEELDRTLRARSEMAGANYGLFLDFVLSRACADGLSYKTLEVSFLAVAAAMGLLNFVTWKLDKEPGLIHQSSGCLLLSALRPLRQDEHFDSKIRMLQLLLQRGAEPNCSFGQKSSWSSYLGRVYDKKIGFEEDGMPPNDYFQLDFSFIHEMLKYGADLEADCIEVAEHRLVAEDIVRMVLTFDQCEALGTLLPERWSRADTELQNLTALGVEESPKPLPAGDYPTAPGVEEGPKPLPTGDYPTAPGAEDSAKRFRNRYSFQAIFGGKKKLKK